MEVMQVPGETRERWRRPVWFSISQSLVPPLNPRSLLKLKFLASLLSDEDDEEQDGPTAPEVRKRLFDFLSTQNPH